MVLRFYLSSAFIVILVCLPNFLKAQCGGQIMEPGFQFLTSSRGCAPFNVRIETLYLSSTPGTLYYVDWGDGTPEETYVQTNATGVTIAHTYPNSPVDCGYIVRIDSENGCNPRGSVVPIETQVIVWTNDVISINPAVYRVCQGYAANVLFTDDSDWNCYPRATRENNEARWIQWIYGTGPLANQIPGVTVNSVLPGAFPYLDPAPGRNPIYPVLAPGQVSLPIQVPVTTPADIGREFQITLKNWNQCNPYDNVLLDGNPFNPVNGNLVNGDNAPQVTTARIVIVPAPAPTFVTRLGNVSGPIQSVFCIDDLIFFQNQTPAIGGAAFAYTWEFFDDATGLGAPIATRNNASPTFSYSTTGQKLVRLRVRDSNAAGGCEAIFDRIITISPSLIAQIRVTDLANNVITPDFCQSATAPFSTFNVRFSDVSVGTPTPTSQWRWEFYDQNNNLAFESPSGGAFSNATLGPFDRTFLAKGTYRVRLRIRDNITSCESVDEVQVRIFESPSSLFSFNRVCEGNPIQFTDASSINSLPGDVIVSREWDMNYNGTTFLKEAALDNQLTPTFTFPTAGTWRVALRVTSSSGCSSISEQNVIVDPLPNATFSADRDAGCSTLTIQFTNNSIVGQTDVIREYIWEVDAGTGFQTDSVQRPTDPGFSPLFIRDFINNGTANRIYQIRLRVITVNNCEQVSAPRSITVFPSPRSGFVSLNYSPFASNCSPLTVNFSVDDNTQALNPDNYQWTISDNTGVISSASTGTTPSYSFDFVNNTALIKDFFVTLRANLPSGCFGDSTRLIRISPIPSSAFTIDTISYNCERVRLRMEAVQKGLPQYTWSVSLNGAVVFGSSTIGEILEYEVVRSLVVNQDLDISLRTTNLANCQSPATTQRVTLPRAVNLVADFAATPAIQTLPNSTISILNNSTPGPWQYAWDLGDGTVSNDPALSTHTYATYGSYTISLTISNNDCESVTSRTITINPIPPVVDFTYDPASGCAPLTVNFTNLSQYADPSTYQWEFGANQGRSNAVNPTYTYFEPGVYTVTLSASNITGQTAQEVKQLIIEVYDRPNASFAIKPRTVYIPGTKMYTDNDSFNSTSWLWDFGDGTTSTDFEPIHEYRQEGIFDITLIAYNSEGCADTARLDAGVQAIKAAQILIPNAFTPNLNGPGNASGQNDVFKPLMRGVTEYQMMVFNRWGQLLFETDNIDQGWDGYFQGKLCQQDVYVYKINARSENGEKFTRTGDIHLIR